MGAACWVSYTVLKEILWEKGFAARLILISGVTTLGIGIYFALTTLLRTEGVPDAIRILLRRKGEISWGCHDNGSNRAVGGG